MRVLYVLIRIFTDIRICILPIWELNYYKTLYFETNAYSVFLNVVQVGLSPNKLEYIEISMLFLSTTFLLRKCFVPTLYLTP